MANPEPNIATRFQPGVSGNPGGISRMHRQFQQGLLHALVTDDPLARAKELSDLAWAAARDREPWAIQLLFQRLLPQTLNLHLENGGDVREMQQLFLTAIAVLPPEQRNAVAKQMLAIESAEAVEVKPNGSNGSSNGHAG